MAALTDLINQVEDKALRERLMQEAARLTKQKKFGLVFEEHIPECTPLYGITIKRDSTVSKKTGVINDVYRVTKITDDEASCIRLASGESETVALSELVPVAQFGEPIYPTLQPIDRVENAPDSNLWHTLIEADNYHALQLLEYLYPQQVDCIYIDPPYNTGARDWKYNNDYVDSSDSWRHSKWLSMMQKRLKIAKRILNPNNSVLIVTIDEKEYLHLGCLLEEMFPEARMQMISSVIARNGSSRRDSFSRSNEFIYIVQFGDSIPSPLALSNEWVSNGDTSIRKEGFQWGSFVRQGANGKRSARPNLFYPIFVSKDGKRFLGAGRPLPLGVDRTTIIPPNDAIAIWPIHTNGSEGTWGYSYEGAIELAHRGFLRLGKLTSKGMGISYATSGPQKKIESGEIPTKGKREDGSWIIDEDNVETKFLPSTQWNIQSHDATYYGTNILSSIIGKGRFSFPKSLYAVRDTIRFFVANNPNAIIVDFFAGSGTTLHAVNLLNAEDSGHRRCIMVTNNEVSVDEAKTLSEQGYQPGDPEWEKLGIARYVTWPRTVCSIEGHDVNGVPLKGDYLANDADGNPIPMAQGFKTNCEYFKLGFLDKNDVALGKQFAEILPLLWLKAGAIGRRPELGDGDVPEMLILPQNNLAVLVDECIYIDFQKVLEEHPEIDTVFIVTDSERAYREMIASLRAKHTYQLYRSYLDNFRINARR